MTSVMNIGQAAHASGVSAKMVRYYESIGLISRATRTDAGYRTYTMTDVNALRFIKRARTLGFSIERIKALLELWNDKQRASSDVRRVALAHVAELQAKIEELTSMSAALQELASSCHGDSRPNCPILRDLAGSAASPEPESSVSRGVAYDGQRFHTAVASR